MSELLPEPVTVVGLRYAPAGAPEIERPTGEVNPVVAFIAMEKDALLPAVMVWMAGLVLSRKSKTGAGPWVIQNEKPLAVIEPLRIAAVGLASTV